MSFQPTPWKLVAGAALLYLMAAAPAAAQVHRWVDEHGKVHYGDRPATGATPLRLNTAPPASPAAVPAGAVKPAPAGGGSPAATGSAASRSRTGERLTPGTIDRLLAQEHAQHTTPNRRGAAPAAPDASSPGMQQLIAQCKANRGVDCDTPQGMRNLQRENTPITPEEQARIAGLRARKASCARTPQALGC